MINRTYLNNVNNKFGLIIFLIILQKTEYLISLYTGVNIFFWLPFSPFVLIMLLTLLALYRILKLTEFNERLMDPFLQILLVYVFLQFFRGILLNSLNIVIQEFSTGLLVFYAYILGRNRLIDFSRSFYFGVVIFSSFLVFLGIFHFREHLEGQLSVLTPTATLAYEIGPILDLWPLVFLTRYFRRQNVVALVPLIIYLFFQLFFLKRAPSVRAVTYFITAEFLLLMLTRNIYVKLRNSILVVLMLFVFLAFMPRELKDRFGNGDTSRQDETIDMLSQLSYGELLLGRGLGGWFELDEGGGITKLHNGSYGKYIVHMGVAYPILKGGILLLLLIVLHFLSTLTISIKNLYSLSADEKASLVFILVYGLFRLIEGPFSPGALFDGLCFGYSMGRLNAKY